MLLRAAAAWAAAGFASAAAASEPAAITSLQVSREDDALTLSFGVRFELSRAVEDALMKGVPLHFRADVELYRYRWYWADRQVASASRLWRLAYLPLTRQFRVTFGGLNQNFDSVEEAIASFSRVAAWRIADASAIEEGTRHYVELRWRLDTSLLPRPMQIGIAGQPEWTLQLQNSRRVE